MIVIPAKAGIHAWRLLDSRLRGNDDHIGGSERLHYKTSRFFLETIKMDKLEGIVKRTDLSFPSASLPGETLAIEVLTKPIEFKIDKTKLNIVVDRREVKYAVINTAGKSNLCESHAMVNMDRMEELMDLDNIIHNYLLNPSEGFDINELDWKDKIMPLRWASAGVLPLVTIGSDPDNCWIPFFFRDIWPAGWNIPLGATQRHFGENGVGDGSWESELNDPLITSSREFLEETLILDREPSFKAYYRRFDLESDSKGSIRTSEFSKMTSKLRKKYDCMTIKPADSKTKILHANVVKTNNNLIVLDAFGTANHINNVLVAFSLSDLGVEVVRVVKFDIDDFDPYFLDGEVLEYPTPELTRMPVALISCEYLKSVFSGDITKFDRVRKCTESSIVVDKQMKPRDIKLFDWDHRQRIDIIECEKEGVGTEMQRYRQWASSFLDDKDNLKEKACRMFTPATAKILNLFFKTVDPLELAKKATNA